MARDGLTGKLLDYAEDRFGVRVVDSEALGQIQESWHHLRDFAEEVSELGYHSLDMIGGRPNEMRPEKRVSLSMRSRKALREDPLARAEASLLANFSFGRGVGKPQCVSDAVQAVVDEAWDDPVNAEKLTSFEAQRHRSNELITQANLYPTAFVRNGRVRIGFLDADTIEYVVTDDEDDELPLWYVGRKRRAEWDYKEDRFAITDEMKEGYLPKVVYRRHWRHVERLIEEAAENGEKPPEGPPSEKVEDGLVYHVRINRIGRTQFGTPPWAASLRFFSAMNTLTEAHVAMAQARATWIAKRVRKGGPSSVVAGANAALSQTGELAASRLFGGAVTEGTVTQTDAAARTSRTSLAPPTPGALWVENEADRLESLNLSSGAGEAHTTAQIVRAPIAAAAQFGQHYLGDASDANLATATSLELPTQFNIGAWQETHEQMLRWFVDLVIQEAVRAGRLGGLAERLTEGEAEERGRPLTRAERKPLSDLALREVVDRAEMERRTGEDLGYTFEMPHPGRRNLPEVVSAVTGISSSFDPAGMNVPLRRAMLLFLARDGLGVDNPRHWVDEILPADALFLPGAGGGPAAPGAEPPPEEERSEYGERTTGGTAKGSSRAERAQEGWMPEPLITPMEQLGAELDVLWKTLVEDPAVTASIAVAGGASSVNGASGG